MKKTAKLLLCFLLILSLLLTAAACSKKEEKQNAAGYYILEAVSEDDEELDLEALGFSQDEAFLLLNEDGTAVLYLFDELTDLTWRNDQLRSVEGDDPLTFKLEDKLLTFEIDGTELTFKRSKDDPPDIDALRQKLAEPTEPAAPDGPVGCYVLDSMTMEGTTIDAEMLASLGMTAYIEFFEDGTGTIDLMGETEDFEWEDDTIFLIPMSVLKGQLKSVRMQNAATSYVRPNSMQLTQERDLFLYRNVTRTARPKNNSGSGGSSGGGSHSSTGGRSGSV